MLHFFHRLHIAELNNANRDCGLSDVAHIHLFQHLLLPQEELRHIEGMVQLLFFKFVTKLAHLCSKSSMPWKFAHVHTAVSTPQSDGLRRHNLVGTSILEHTILVNASTVGE